MKILLLLFILPALIILAVLLSTFGDFIDKITSNVKEKKGHTVIICECGNNLCMGNSFISDTYDEDNYNHVKYKCEVCGLECDYNFDIAPVPINWKDLTESK